MFSGNTFAAAAAVDKLSLSQQKAFFTSTLLSEQMKVNVASSMKMIAVDGAAAKSTAGLTMEEINNLIATEANTQGKVKNQASTLSLGNAYRGLTASVGASTANFMVGATAVVAFAGVAYSLYQSHIQKQKELAQATADATRTYNDQKSEISDYVQKYEDLQKELKNANTTEERQLEIKKELLSLQKELNEKYGEEFGKVNLVTDAYREQTDALKNLNKELAQKFLDENADGINKAKEALEEINTYSILSNHDGAYTGMYNNIKAIADEFAGDGLKLLPGTSDDTYSIVINANAESAEKTIREFQHKVRELLKDGNSELDQYFNDHYNSVLGDASIALKSAQTDIGDNPDILNSALMAEIKMSSTLSTTYDQATRSVDKFNEAVISGDFDGVLIAKENMEQVQSSIDLTSDIYRDYERIFNNVFDSADTRAIDFRVSLDDKEYVEQLKLLEGKTVTELEAMYDDGLNGDVFDSITEAAKKYELTLDEIINVLIDLGIIQADVAEEIEEVFKPSSKADMISKVNELSEGFESLDKIMTSIKDDNPFNYALLDDKNFKEIFSPLGEEYTNFVETISSSPKDIGACQSAFDNLVTSLLNKSGIFSGLTDEYADLTAAMLKNMGVANAEEFVISTLAQNQADLAAQKYYNEVATYALADATASEIDQILQEAEIAGIASEEIARLELAKMIANGTALATDGDIENVKALMIACDKGIVAIQAFQQVKADLLNNVLSKPRELPRPFNEHGLYDPISYQKQMNDMKKEAEDYNAKLKDAEAEVLAAINDVGKGGATYNGGTKTNKPSGGSKGSDSKKEKEEKEKEFDWMQRALDAMNKKREEYQSIVDDETESYADQISALKELIVLDQQYIDLNAKAVETYTDRWEKAKQKIIETFGEIEGNDYIAKIQIGDNSIEGSLSNIKGEDNIEAIEAAISAYDDLSDAKDKQVEEEKKRAQRIRDMYQARIDEIKSFISEAESALSMAQSKMDIKEIVGKEITERDYKDLISLSEDQIDLYYDQISALQDLQSEVEEQGPEYYNIQSQIASCEAAIASAEKQQAEWNEEIKRLPIKRIERYLELLGHIKEDLQNFMNEQSVLGTDGNKDQYQQLIDISQEQIDKLLEQQKLLQDNLSGYEYNSDKYNEVAGEIQDIDNEISDLIQSQHEWNKAILQIPINQLTKASDALQTVSNTIGDIISDYDTVISAIVSTIEKEIDALNDMKDITSDEFEERINVLQEQLDLLQKQNKERQIQLDLEQAQYDLERARGQKTVATVRNGELTYEADADAVRNASESLQDAEYNKMIHDLETQISSLEDERDTLLDSYDDQIEKLEKIKDKWSELTDEIKLAADQMKVTDMYGEEWQEKVLSGNDSAMYESMKDMYSTIYNQQQAYQDQIASNERIADMMNQFMEKFYDGSLTYEQAMSGIDNLMNSMADGFSGLEYLDSLLNINGASDLNNLLSNMKDSAAESVNQFQDYMEIVKANADSLDKYSSTWEEMQKSIQEQIVELKRLYEENLKRRQESASKRHSSSSGGERDETWTSSKTGPGGSTYSYDSGKTYDSYSDYWDSERDPDRHHSGVDAGYVGATGTQDEKLKAIQALSTNDLTQNEVPIIAQQGELVLTPNQISQLLNNFDGAIGQMNSLNKLHAASSLPLNTPQYIETDKSTDVTINMGNIELPDVRDVDGFAKAIGKQFKSIMRQELTK